jgi:predicted DNA-binding transcriptional regulator AlpA
MEQNQGNLSGIDYDKLADAIASRMSVPPERVIWDVEQCANYLHQGIRTFRDRTSKHHTFPAPIPFPAVKGAANLRWYASEVMEWVSSLSH